MADLEREPAKLSAADLEYLRTQAGSPGSGLLGGWSEIEYGGCFEEGDEGGRTEEVRAEIASLRAVAHGGPAEPSQTEPEITEFDSELGG